MKFILSLLLFSTFAFANYSIYYGDLKLGIIQNFDTIKENYLKVNVTSSLARFFLGKKELIFYEENATLEKNNKNTKYKRDKYHVIDIIRQSINNSLKEGKIAVAKDKYLNISKDKDYAFKYVSKGRIKSQGNIKVQNAQLLLLTDSKNHLKIVKN